MHFSTTVAVTSVPEHSKIQLVFSSPLPLINLAKTSHTHRCTPASVPHSIGLGRQAKNAILLIYGGMPEASNEMAVKCFQHAISLEDYPPHHVELGKVYLTMGKKEEARACFEEALKQGERRYARGTSVANAPQRELPHRKATFKTLPGKRPMRPILKICHHPYACYTCQTLTPATPLCTRFRPPSSASSSCTNPPSFPSPLHSVNTYLVILISPHPLLPSPLPTRLFQHLEGVKLPVDVDYLEEAQQRLAEL